ncbi:MAG: UPF0147 family protein [Candidatus Thermoplasmatota archaeon]|nr:UPF0147 family protein [Candidatus Thermoplasmatota archaeon]
MSDVDEQLEEVCEKMDRIMEDNSIPRNIREGAEECSDLLLDSEDELDVRIASSIFKLEELADDPNIPLHGRTLIWNVISELESIKDESS